MAGRVIPLTPEAQARRNRYTLLFDLIRQGKLDKSAPSDPNPIKWKPKLDPGERLR